MLILISSTLTQVLAQTQATLGSAANAVGNFVDAHTFVKVTIGFTAFLVSMKIACKSVKCLLDWFLRG